MVSTHAAWYQDKADQIIVPTEAARVRARIVMGSNLKKSKWLGFRLQNSFANWLAIKMLLKEKLGWPKDLPVVLLVGGGDGMGPLEEVSREINDRKLPAAYGSGRNRPKQRS